MKLLSRVVSFILPISLSLSFSSAHAEDSNSFFAFDDLEKTSCGEYETSTYRLLRKNVDMHFCDKTYLITFPGDASPTAFRYVKGIEKVKISELKAWIENHHENSFLSLYESGEVGASLLKGSIGRECADGLLRLKNAGKDLTMSAVIKQSYKLLTQNYDSKKQDLTFYHYTNSRKFWKESNENASMHSKDPNQRIFFDEIFHFLRVQSVTEKKKCPDYWKCVFYVAEDPYSSKAFGDFKITLELDGNSDVISFGSSREYVSLFNSASRELFSKYPELTQDCSGNSPNANDLYPSSNLLLVLLEESGIEVISYDYESQWFQILSPNAFSAVLN